MRKQAVNHARQVSISIQRLMGAKFVHLAHLLPPQVNLSVQNAVPVNFKMMKDRRHANYVLQVSTRQQMQVVAALA